MVSTVIAGLGIAVPRPVAQRALWEHCFRDHFFDSPAARRVFANAGVRRRHTVVDLTAERPYEWSTGTRMARYGVEAPSLGHRAVTAALADAGMEAADIGQLTVVSCTGYGTPGLDIRLAGSLGLGADTHRLLVGHMGCYAALPALGAAADFVATRGRPAVLLCLELASLHFQPPTRDLQQVVSHALFGDAAVALVLRPDPAPGRAGERARRRGPELELIDIAAHTDQASSELMSWQITDTGFRMELSPEVPEVLAKHVRPVTEELLARHGLDLAAVEGWAVHPGGPRILETIEEELALPAHALEPSRTVLAGYGNCSSPTVLLAVERLTRTGRLRPGAPVVSMAFGPGLTLYAALLRTRPAGKALTSGDSGQSL
jgi:predicted naringenin-chalcone synthase